MQRVQRTSRFPHPLQLATAAHCALLLATGAAHASALSTGMQQLLEGQSFERRISLSTMGVQGSAINIPAGSVQEFYFPAPATSRSRSLLVNAPGNQPAPAFFINGMQQSAQPSSPVATQGQVVTSMKVEGEAAQTRLGMQAGPVPANACDASIRQTAAVALNPDSYLSYYPANTESATPASWSRTAASLPERPFLLVAAPPLSREVFDTAWRVGLAMARLGRPVTIHTLPNVGDVVDTRTLSIPPALTSIAAFAQLNNASAQHSIADHAEVGALLMLDASGLLADIVVADRQLQSQIAHALDALENQISDTDALAVFQQWREQKMPLAKSQTTRAPLTTLAFGAHPAWVVNADAQDHIGALETGTHWQPISATADGAARLASQQADHPLLRASRDVVAAPTQQFIMQAPQNWSANFALVPSITSAHTPTQVRVAFQMPEQSRHQDAVGVLHWNGILLAARKLHARGEREMLTADVPVYALSTINMLQVSVQQNAPDADCQQSTAIPVTALQLDVRFDATAPAANGANPSFADVIPQLGQSADLAVPQSYLTQARMGLTNTIRMAVAANLSPISTQLLLINGDKRFEPTRPFVAMDVPLQDTTRAISVKAGQITLRDKPVQDLPTSQTNGMNDVTAVQALRTQHHAGLLWYPLAQQANIGATGLLINHGSLALLGPGSEVAWINRSGAVVRASDANTAGPMYEWRELFSWGVPVTLAVLVSFIALLLSAYLAARRARDKSQEGVA